MIPFRNTYYVSPCVSCRRRAIGCHGKCEEYLSWRDGYDARKKVFMESKEYSPMMGDYIADQKEKKRKRANRKK